MSNHPGQCFCGSIGYEYQTAIAASDWSIRACQCAFCRAHDALSTSDPAGTLRFHAAKPDNLQRYRFAMRTADFLLCRECGVYIGAVIESDLGRFGIINTHSLKVTPADIAAVAPMTYDSEDEQGRVGRREVRWTPVTGVP
jgi:hypothetical protein